jgi:hypothetical protein
VIDSRVPGVWEKWGESLGFRVQSIRLKGAWIRIESSGEGVGLKVYGLGSRSQASGFRVQGVGFRV